MQLDSVRCVLLQCGRSAPCQDSDGIRCGHLRLRELWTKVLRPVQWNRYKRCIALCESLDRPGNSWSLSCGVSRDWHGHRERQGQCDLHAKHNCDAEQIACASAPRSHLLN